LAKCTSILLPGDNHQHVSVVINRVPQRMLNKLHNKLLTCTGETIWSYGSYHKYHLLLYEIGLYIVKTGKIQIAVKNGYNRGCSCRSMILTVKPSGFIYAE